MLNELLAMFQNTTLDKGVRIHLARALRRQTIVETSELLGGTPRRDRLTRLEISLGKNEGKIQCIKAVRERPNMGLKDAKDLAEAEFTRLGYTFRRYISPEGYPSY